MAITDTVGSRIRVRRRALGLTLGDVAKGAGTNVPSLSRMERNKQGLLYADLESIASALSCAVLDLIPPPTSKVGRSSRKTQRPVKGSANSRTA
jgi:transcriptional regulator with XRE-family HTH domain